MKINILMIFDGEEESDGRHRNKHVYVEFKRTINYIFGEKHQ